MQLFTPARLALLIFTSSYLAIGAVLLWRAHNTEFLIYLCVLAPLIAAAFYLQVRFAIPLWMPWLLSILFLLHLAGGSVIVRGDVLYNLVLVPIPNWTGLTIWKFDQLVHPYGAAVVAACSYGLLRRTSLSPLMAAAVAFMVANGAGALNEVGEFITKITVPGTDVGGYYNTALDLTFNLFGSFAGSLLGLLLIRSRES